MVLRRNHVGEQGNVPLGWRLHLPESWANDAWRRREAGIPEGIVFRKKWELALEIIDQIREWGLPDRAAFLAFLVAPVFGVVGIVTQITEALAGLVPSCGNSRSTTPCGRGSEALAEP